jgi:hypothetical protein
VLKSTGLPGLDSETKLSHPCTTLGGERVINNISYTLPWKCRVAQKSIKWLVKYTLKYVRNYFIYVILTEFTKNCPK